MIFPGQKIDFYSHQNLISIVKWIDSDTLLRDEDEVVEEVMMELGFKRHGAKIVAAIKSAVRAARSDQPRI